MVYLVRHAHAGKKSEWEGDDLLRPLSAQGRLQAVGLIARLDPYPVRRILSSPADRCLQTVEPLARQRGLEIEARDVLGVDGSGSGVLHLLGDAALGEVVLCTHGELIGQVFEQLEQAGVELSSRPMWQKGSTWVLDRDGARTWKGAYLQPLSIRDRPAGPAAKVTTRRRGGG